MSRGRYLIVRIFKSLVQVATLELSAAVGALNIICLVRAEPGVGHRPVAAVFFVGDTWRALELSDRVSL